MLQNTTQGNEIICPRRCFLCNVISPNYSQFTCSVIMYDLDYRFVQVPLVAQLKEPSKNNYSSYTLYLVYLAIPDLALHFYILVMYSSYVNQVYNPYFNGGHYKFEMEDVHSKYTRRIIYCWDEFNLVLFEMYLARFEPLSF